MRTEDLIRVIAADAAPRRPLGPVLALTVVAIAAGVGPPALAILGVNIGAMLTPPLVLLRQGFPLLLGIGAALTALRLARPGLQPGAGRWLMLAALALAAAVIGREFARVPEADWGQAAMGSTAAYCLGSVSLIGVPLLAGALWALGRGASMHPRLSGALAGLLAGSVSAAIYALHCVETSPIFYATWYGLAILGITGLGALVGPRMLRW